MSLRSSSSPSVKAIMRFFESGDQVMIASDSSYLSVLGTIRLGVRSRLRMELLMSVI